MPKTNSWVLIDTSAWIHALRPGGLSNIRQQVRNILTEGRAATCEIIILELLSGVRTEKEYWELYEDLKALQQFPITDIVWEQAYRLAHMLRSKGLSVPATDQLIASVAFTRSCNLLHCDKHFDLMAKYIKLSSQVLWMFN